MAVSEIRVPDLEGAENVGVVEIYVSPGDAIEIETPLVSLESDKAVMDVPSPVAGTISEVKIAEGDSVNAGDLIALAEVSADAPPEESAAASPAEKKAAETAADSGAPEDEATAGAEPTAAAPINRQAVGSRYHATPSVRSLARELGVNLAQVKGTGPKGRITRGDLSGLVKSVMSGRQAPAGAVSMGLPPIPEADYAAFGEVAVEKLSRIKKISGPHLHRNWIGVPHVTQFNEADLTELETFRQSLNEEGAQIGAVRISPLIFIIRAVVKALAEYPDFNSSLNPDGATLTRKKYYNIGVAVDTPGGLLVPVIKAADTKGIRKLAEELADLSSRARDGKLKMDEMTGATFTISSIGGIGGTNFTPIVNAPEAAILGLSKSAMKPIWNGSEFIPRLMLPFSVSYDHRVIDGAQGARFAVYLASVISDIRHALL